jgi:chromosome segregation ATPase
MFFRRGKGGSNDGGPGNEAAASGSATATVAMTPPPAPAAPATVAGTEDLISVISASSDLIMVQEKLKKSVLNFQRQYAQNANLLEASREQVTQLNDRKRQLEETLETHEQKLDQYREEQEELIVKLNVATSQLTLLTRQYQDVTKEREEFEERAKLLMKHNAALEENLPKLRHAESLFEAEKAAREAVEKRLSDMRLDLDKERQEVALLTEKNADFYQNLTRKEDEINLATRTIGELRAQIIDLQGAIEEQTDNYQTVKNRLDNLSQEKFTLEGTIRRLERELEDTRVSKESKIEILERLNNSMRETIGKQTIEMNTLQISERKLSVDLKTIDAVNARLSRSLEEANNAIARMDTERKANNAKIKKTEQESKTLQNQVDLLNDQLEVLKAKISQAQAMNIDLQKTANENKEKFAEGEERMRVEIAMLKGSVESLRKERDTQAREITNLRNIISEMSIVGKAVIEGGSKAENVIRFNADDKKGNKGDEE